MGFPQQYICHQLPVALCAVTLICILHSTTVVHGCGSFLLMIMSQDGPAGAVLSRIGCAVFQCNSVVVCLSVITSADASGSHSLHNIIIHLLDGMLSNCHHWHLAPSAYVAGRSCDASATP